MPLSWQGGFTRAVVAAVAWSLVRFRDCSQYYFAFNKNFEALNRFDWSCHRPHHGGANCWVCSHDGANYDPWLRTVNCIGSSHIRKLKKQSPAISGIYWRSLYFIKYLCCFVSLSLKRRSDIWLIAYLVPVAATLLQLYGFLFIKLNIWFEKVNIFFF